MATLIDLEGEFQYKPQFTPKPYDPGLPEDTPTPAAQPVNPNKWNSEFQTWEDQSGNLWDEANQVWWSRQGSVYRDKVGWQSVNEFNDYNKVLDEFNQYSQNPVVSQPSAFQPSQMAIPRAGLASYDLATDNMRNDNPRAAFTEYDLATSRDVPFPSTPKYKPAAAYARGGYDLQGHKIQQGDPRLNPVADTGGSNVLSKIYNAYTKNVQNPVAESLAQLTPGVIEGMRYVPSSSALGNILSLGGKALGADTRSSAIPGIQKLGSAAADPTSFVETQNRNLAERPAWQQFAATTAYDPLNLVGGGIGAAALNRGIEGTNLLSKIARAAATADRAIDVGQTKAFGALLKPVGKGLTPLASEVGSLPAKVGARAGLAAGAGVAGYMTADDDATAQEKLLRALGFAAGVAAGPEVIGKTASLSSKAYGKAITKIGETGLDNLGIGVERGIGHQQWLEDAPISDVLDGTGVDPILYLKDVSADKSLPLRTRISNAFWGTLAKADRDRFITNVDDARIRNIAVMDKTNREAIPNVADIATNEYAPDLGMFPVDENGSVLINGARLPALGPDGLPIIRDGEPLMGAGFADLHEKKEWYLENGFIDQEQYDALNRIQAALMPYHDLQTSFGLAPDPDLRIDPTAGAYFPRGKASSQIADTTAAREIPGTKAGIEPGSSKDRGYVSQAEGIADGRKYASPAETFKRYITEVLGQVNAENTSHNLEKVAFEVELKTGKQTIKLGDLRPNQELKRNLDEQIRASRDLRKELRQLKTRQARIDRDVRLGTRWVDQQRNRVESLGKTITDQTIDASARAEAAYDSLAITKQALKDAESAAREYSTATAKSAIKDSESRKVLNEVLAEAKRVSDELNKLEDAVRLGEMADLQQKVSGAWNFADGIRAAVAQDVSALERVMADLSNRYGDALPARTAAQEALGKVKGQFSEAITGFRQLAREGQQLSAREATAAANVRAMLNTGRTKELDRIIERRANSLKGAVANSQELGVEIDRLKQMLAPTRANVKQIQQDIQATRNLARQVSERYPKGKIAGVGWGLKGWENVPMPTELANAFRKYELQKGTTGVAGNLYDLVNNVFRMLGATADASRTATVGLLSFADKPGTSMKGFATGVKTAFPEVMGGDPTAAARILRELEQEATSEGLPKLTSAVARGLQMSSSEQLLKGLADEGTWVDSLAKKPVFKQAETLYSVPANVERASRFYDTLRAWKAAGKDYTSDKALAMAANAANTLTGRASRGMGEIIIGSKGASRLFFAPRFVQSQFESLGNALLVGGVEGEEARRAMLKLVLGGAALTYGVNELLGNKTDFDLMKDGRVNSNFMRIRIGDQDISVFGPWDSLAKGLLATAMGDPDYFLRSKLGPLPGIAADTIAGMNSIGERIPKPWEKEYYTPDNLARIAPVPFGARNIAEVAMKTDPTDPASIGNLALATGASVLGVKSSPLTDREQYIRTLEGVYPEYKPTVNYPKPTNPDDDPLFMADFASKNPSKVPEASSELGKELQKTREPIQKNIATNNKKFMDGEKNLGDWKDARKTLKTEERAAIQHIVDQFKDDNPPEDSPRYWVNEYFKTFEEATVDGLLDFDKLDTLQAKLLSAAPPWVQDYMDAYLIATSDPGAEREYRTAISQLDKDGYFSGESNSIPRYQGMLSGKSDKEIDDYRKIIDDWSKRPEYAFLKGKSTESKAAVILGDFWEKTGKEYDPILVKDVGNSAKEKFQSIEYKLYKAEHPDLLAWLNPDLSYETIKSIAAE